MLNNVLRTLLRMLFGRRPPGRSSSPLPPTQRIPTADHTDLGQTKVVAGTIVVLRPATNGKHIMLNRGGMATRPMSAHDVVILEKRLRQSKRARMAFEKNPQSNFLKPRQPGH